MLGGSLGLVAWYASSQINPIRRRNCFDSYTFTPWELGVPYEPVVLRTPDNINLRGWWMPRPGVQSVIIGCHGHVGAKDDLLGIGTGLWRDGHNVLLFDFRGRGESDPWPNTLAHQEVADLLTVIAYVQERIPAAHIGIVGFSMGASVALLAAAREPAIAAIVADSPFTSAADVVASRMQRIAPLVAGPLLMLTEALIAQRHGYYLSQIRPIDAVALLAPRPLLLIHATDDSITPVSHAYQLFAAAHEPKELWIHEGIEHCGAYFADRRAYVARVSSFFQQYLTSIE